MSAFDLITQSGEYHWPVDAIDSKRVMRRNDNTTVKEGAMYDFRWEGAPYA